MAMTTETLERLKTTAAKGKEIAQKARDAKASEARKQEWFAEWKGWMEEQNSVLVPAQRQENLTSKGFVYDVPSSVEADTLDVMVKKSAKSYGAREAEVRQLHRLNDTLLMASQIYRPMGIDGAKIAPHQMQIYQDFIRGKSELAKALATSITNQGSEWMVTGFSQTFFERVEADLVVARLHGEPITVPMGMQSLDIGAAGAAVTAYKITESISDESDKIPTLSPNTRKVTLTPKDIGARTLVSVQQTEDAAVATVPYVERQLITAYARAIDTADINGDTAATHQDTDVTAATDAKKLWNGYRKNANTATKIDANDTVSSANLRKVLQAMGIYGQPGDVALITNAVGWWKLNTLTEVLTVDKYGANASILTGERGNIFGNPIIWSDLVKEDLNESGVYDGTTTNETQIVFVNMNSYVHGLKREAAIETEKDIETQQIKVVVTGRIDFQRKYASADTCEGTLYDINTTT